MARGFYQKEGIDYEEIFAPISRYTSIRTMMEISSMMKWILHHMDVKIAFLNVVYIEQPQGFEVEYRQTYIFNFNKDPYGLRQDPSYWY